MKGSCNENGIQPGHSRIWSSLRWLIFWVALAMIFCAFLYFRKGADSAVDFLGGYVIELSLSLDNVFVFLMIFISFGIEEHAQHKVLRWGILGAFVLRFIFIVFGVALVRRFEWVLYLFGVLLLYSGAKMFRQEKEKDPKNSPILRLTRMILPVSRDFDGDRFLTTEHGKRKVTPLMAIMILIIFSDILFAVDSVPAVLSVSRDLLIVYTSNVFALLGLWQLFFIIEHLQERFSLVKYGVACILIFTGLKMLGGIADIHISTPLSIGIILGIIVASILLSAIFTRPKHLSKK